MKIPASAPADSFRSLRLHPSVANRSGAFLGKTFQYPIGTKSIILRDDYNPLDVYDLLLKEIIRKSILENTEWDILIG